MLDMNVIKKLSTLPVLLVKKTTLLSALSCRLVKFTGKHPEPIHPKHLITLRSPWYLSYIKKTDIVLDIGCNNGQHTLRIAKNSAHVFGIDYDRRMLEIAAREIKRAGLKNVTVKEVNIENGLPFKSKKFDAVIFLDVLEHLNNREHIMFEVKRVLKSKGMLLLSVPNSDTAWKRIQKRCGLNYFSDPDHKVEYTKKEIVHYLKKAKFNIKNVFPVTFDTPWVGFIDVLGGISLTCYRQLSMWRRNKALVNPQESIGFEIISQKQSV